MGPERNRRFIALLLVSVLLLISSWIEEQFENALSNTEINYNKKSGEHIFSSGHESQIERKKQGEDEDKEEEEERMLPGYSRIIKSKSRVVSGGPVIHLDIMSCLPRFICEVHAQPPGGQQLSELEKDILTLFRSSVILEGPSSPVYQYQLAAHMGQLSSGFEPSPCHGLFSACALSRMQLIDILKGVKTSRRMFF